MVLLISFYLELIYLNVIFLSFLEIGVESVDKKLAPFVRPIFGRVLVIYELLQWLHLSFLCREEEEWNGKSFFLRVYHHSMLWTLICIITPNLHKQQPQNFYPPSNNNLIK